MKNKNLSTCSSTLPDFKDTGCREVGARTEKVFIDIKTNKVYDEYKNFIGTAEFKDFIWIITRKLTIIK